MSEMSDKFDLEDELHNLVTKAINDHDISYDDVVTHFQNVLAELEEENEE
jgi:hypothetical protein